MFDVIAKIVEEGIEQGVIARMSFLAISIEHNMLRNAMSGNRMESHTMIGAQQQESQWL